MNPKKPTPPSSPPLPADVVLSVRGVKKKFCRNLKRSMYYGILDLAQNLVGLRPDSTGLRKHEFWALDDVSFDLRQGERLGIIGLNGSGKTTLLRVLTGIFPPDQGEVAIRGQVSGLIALGAGMHPHMTGRENIYLNGAILGMPREEIDEKFDSIVRFSEQEDFLDAPLSSYSSGMKVKLGFAVAVHREPDVLLIDEVLAVGDYAFVNKSLRLLHDYHEKAKALIYISHNLEQVRNLCDRVIVLDKGRVVHDSISDEAIAFYQDLCAASTVTRKLADGQPRKSLGVDFFSDALDVTEFGVADSEWKPTTEVGLDEPLRVCYKFRVYERPRRLFFSLGIHDERRNVLIWVMSNDFQKEDFGHLVPGSYELRITIPEHHLMPGVYFAASGIRDDDTMETCGRVCADSTFAVHGDLRTVSRGVIRVDEDWEMRSLPRDGDEAIRHTFEREGD